MKKSPQCAKDAAYADRAHHHKPSERSRCMWDHNADQWVREGVRSMGWDRYDGFMDLIKRARGIGPRGIWRAGLATETVHPVEFSHNHHRHPPSLSSFTSSSTYNLPRVPLQRPREGENVLSRPPRCWVGMQSWCISPSPHLSLSLILYFLPIFLSLYFSYLSLSFSLPSFSHFSVSLLSPDSLWIKSRAQTTKQVRVVCGRVIFTHPYIVLSTLGQFCLLSKVSSRLKWLASNGRWYIGFWEILQIMY